MLLLFSVIGDLVPQKTINVMKSDFVICWVDVEKSVGPSSHVGC